jgi:CrcB protein
VFRDFEVKISMQSSVFVQTILVGLAGSLGASARYLLGRIVAKRVSSQIPFGTLLINVTGAFAIGLLFALTSQKFLSPALQTILATGFLGGYTTFSTLCWEGTQLIRKGNTAQSLCYFASTFMLGLFAVVLGIALGGIL